MMICPTEILVRLERVWADMHLNVSIIVQQVCADRCVGKYVDVRRFN